MGELATDADSAVVPDVDADRLSVLADTIDDDNDDDDDVDDDDDATVSERRSSGGCADAFDTDVAGCTLS
jgi:hypothetical protein